MALLRRAALLAAVAVSATVLVAPGPVSAGPSAAGTVRMYTYIDLGLLPGVPSTCCRSAANSLNNAGEVTGTSAAPGRLSGVAYVFRDGRMTSLGSISTGYFATSYGSGLNDAGAIVGYTSVSNSQPPHAFIYRNGVMSDLGTGFGSGSFSRANDISNGGHVVGLRAATQLGTTRASLWLNGRITDLPGLSSLDSEATAVNDAGQVAGLSRTADGAWRAVIWVNGRVRDLGTLGGDHEAASANDIAETGSVVGSAPAPGQQVHAFLWRDGVMRDLGTLPGGDGFSTAHGVNRLDQAVGVATVPGGPTDHRNRAVLFEDGEVIDLNTRVVNLPATISLASANAINDHGVIVGNSCVLPCNPFASVGTGFMLVPTS